MRIVSLLPSATEIVCALGLRDQLVGVSHRCDYPPEIEGVAVVTRPRVAAAMDARGVAAVTDRLVAKAGIDDELEPSELDVEALLACQPDLIFVRDSSSRPRGRDVREAVRAMESEPVVVSLDAVSLEGIFHTIATIGAMTELEDEAIGLLEALREDLSDLEQQVVIRHDQGIKAPRVVVLQSLEPPFASGLWIPEQVRRAGGWDLLGREGEVGPLTSWDAIAEVDPQMLVMAPVRMHLPEAKRTWARTPKPECWGDIAAVRRGQVFIVEPVYFCRPGPRVVDGVAMLAEIFDPEGFIETSPPASWTPLFE